MVVIDASVAFKWFSTEKELFLNQALRLLDSHLLKKAIIIVPDLMIYELANAWTTRTKIPVNKIKIFLKDLEDTGLNIETATFKLLTKSAVFAKKYQVSVYDAIYAVLAKEKKCKLITADIKFIKKVRLPFIKSLEEI